MISAGIQIEGLAAFRRDLKKIDDELPKELREEMLDIGREIARETQIRVPHKSGKAAASIRAGVSGNNAYVQGGNRITPYYGWLDFGGREPVKGRSRAVGPWKGSGAGPQGGRFLYPTIRRNRAEIEAKAQAAFDKTAEKALEKEY